MHDRTRKLWDKQHKLVGDRVPLMRAIAQATGEVAKVFYPGSYVDITPSLVWKSVTYLDIDRRAAQFFNECARRSSSHHAVL